MPIPIIAGVLAAKALYGLGQMVFSKKKKNEKELEKVANNTPRYEGDSSVSDYYNLAKQRFSVNPTQSAMYKRNMGNIGKNTAAGISGLTDRRSGNAGIGALVQGADNAALDTEVQAEEEQGRRFGALGGATQMQNQDSLYKFKTNTIDPYQLKLQLAGMKAKASTDRYNAGVQTVNNAVNDGATLAVGKEWNFGKRKPRMSLAGAGYEDPRV